MQEFIQNILIYVVIITVLQGIITNENYKQYFKFVSGLIMIIMMISPILNFIYDDNGWYKKIEQVLISSDLEDINDELKISSGSFENMVVDRCKKEIEKKVKKMAVKNGVDVGNVEAEIENKNDKIKLCGIDIEISGDATNKKADNGAGIVSVNSINIDNNTCSSNKGKIKKLSKKEARLKSDICGCFELEKDRVTLWH